MFIRFGIHSLLFTAALGACIPEGRDGASFGDASTVPTDTFRSGDRDGATSSDAGSPSVTFAAAVRACALYDACVGGTVAGAFGIETCATWLDHSLSGAEYLDRVRGNVILATPNFLDETETFGIFQSAPSLRPCFLSATTCDDVYRCMNDNAASTACSHASVRCEGTIARMCAYPSQAAGTNASLGSTAFPERNLAFDCASTGETCVQTGAAVGCAHAACNRDSYVPSCAGGAPHNCFDDGASGGLESISSPCESGTTCRVGVFRGANQAACVGDGAACDPLHFSPRCDGSNIVQCDIGGHERTSPCPSPLHCAPRDDGAGHTVGLCVPPPGTDCPSDRPPTSSCEPATGVITNCIDGYSSRVDCRALGHAGCGMSRYSMQPACQ